METLSHHDYIRCQSMVHCKSACSCLMRYVMNVIDVELRCVLMQTTPCIYKRCVHHSDISGAWTNRNYPWHILLHFLLENFKRTRRLICVSEQFICVVCLNAAEYTFKLLDTGLRDLPGPVLKLYFSFKSSFTGIGSFLRPDYFSNLKEDLLIMVGCIHI